MPKKARSYRREFKNGKTISLKKSKDALSALIRLLSSQDWKHYQYTQRILQQQVQQEVKGIGDQSICDLIRRLHLGNFIEITNRKIRLVYEAGINNFQKIYEDAYKFIFERQSAATPA